MHVIIYERELKREREEEGARLEGGEIGGERKRETARDIRKRQVWMACEREKGGWGW